MNNIEEHIKIINTKLQLLIKNYSVLQKENEGMKKMITESSQKEKELKSNIEILQQKVMIMQASASTLDHDEKRIFEKKIDQYIKDIEKCITVLSK